MRPTFDFESPPAEVGESCRNASPAPAGGARQAQGASDPWLVPPLVVIALLLKAAGICLWLFTGYRGPAAALFFGPDPFVLYALFVPSAQGLGRVFTRFVTDRPAIWLTIDDGPDEHDTLPLLDLLERHQARATFFVIGERADRWPHLVREIARRGHEVAHHTHTHPARSFWSATPRQLAAELDRTVSGLRRLAIRPRCFRPPVGIKNLLLASALARRELIPIGWTVRSGDCRAASPEELVTAVVDRLQPGTILLLHEGPSVPAPVRVKGIALLLTAITARGLVCEIPATAQLR